MPGPDGRKHARYDVRLGVRYTNAQQFVTDYVENLSVGGLFIAGAHERELLSETEIDVELPGQGAWCVRAKAVFRLGAAEARRSGRRAGVGFQIIDKPPGFEDALLGYLLRLGRRRDRVVMAGGIPGETQLADSGYRIAPVAPLEGLQRALAGEASNIIAIAIAIAPALSDVYRSAARAAGAGDIVHVITSADEIADLVAHLDAML